MEKAGGVEWAQLLQFQIAFGVQAHLVVAAPNLENELALFDLDGLRVVLSLIVDLLGRPLAGQKIRVVCQNRSGGEHRGCGRKVEH